jgi:hypothetical protein
MSIAAYDLRKLIQAAAPLAAALLAISASQASSRAQAAEAAHMLVIPASDGYGFDDCLSANKACGHVIADAWCEAHGLTSAVSFGRAEDVTASIADRKSAPKLEPGAFIVNCKG